MGVINVFVIRKDNKQITPNMNLVKTCMLPKLRWLRENIVVISSKENILTCEPRKVIHNAVKNPR